MRRSRSVISRWVTGDSGKNARNGYGVSRRGKRRGGYRV